MGLFVILQDAFFGTNSRIFYANIPEKYKHIDFTPPKSVAEEAGRGLELRREQTGDKAGLTPSEAGKEGIGSGVQRAVNLKNRNTVSPEVIRKMVGFFARHSKNIAKARKLKTRAEQVKSNMYVSDLLWGGAPGERWANKVKKQMDKADEESSKKAASKVMSRLRIARNVASRALLDEVKKLIDKAISKIEDLNDEIEKAQDQGLSPDRLWRERDRHIQEIDNLIKGAKATGLAGADSLENPYGRR